MNKKGVTMISIVFYVLSFFVIVSVIGSISIYITKNMDSMSKDTDVEYAQSRFDEYMRTFFKKGSTYNIIRDSTTNSDYIEIKSLADSDKIFIIKYYRTNAENPTGAIFLEEKKLDVVEKRIMIANNIDSILMQEINDSLGKTIRVTLGIRKGNNTELVYFNYGFER